MEDATVAHEGTAGGYHNDFSEGRYSVLQGHGASVGQKKQRRWKSGCHYLAAVGQPPFLKGTPGGVRDMPGDVAGKC